MPSVSGDVSCASIASIPELTHSTLVGVILAEAVLDWRFCKKLDAVELFEMLSFLLDDGDCAVSVEIFIALSGDGEVISIQDV